MKSIRPTCEICVKRSGDTNARETTYTYDEFSRRTRVTYDDSGQVIGESQQLGAETDAEWSADDNSFIVTGSNPVVLIPTRSFEHDKWRS